MTDPDEDPIQRVLKVVEHKRQSVFLDDIYDFLVSKDYLSQIPTLPRRAIIRKHCRILLRAEFTADRLKALWEECVENGRNPAKLFFWNIKATIEDLQE